jgi:flagellar assembly factor FliW
LAFILMDPRSILPDYKVDVAKQELSELAVTSVAELEVYTLVVVPHDRAQVRTNLRAPILISPKHRLGKQIILDGSDYPIQYFLAQHQPGQGQPQEVSNARTDA